MAASNFVFDIDGVLSMLTEHDLDRRVLDQVAQLLIAGRLVAFNTGRNYPWVRERIIEPIRQQIKPGQLDNVFVSAEMGGIAVEFRNGEEVTSRSPYSLQSDQIQQVKKVYDQHAHRRVNWFGDKVTMATIVKPKDQDAVSFAADAAIINESLQDVFAGQHIKVLLNTDAIEVMAPEAGKQAGAELIYDWTQCKALAANHFICLGDNMADYEMACLYASKGHPVDFIFTGEQPGEINQNPTIRFFKTDAPYSQGTYEFLASQRQ